MRNGPDPAAGDFLHLPSSDVGALALEELEFVYAFIYTRVGNRPDAEDLVQQVAMKAIPRLRDDAGPAAVRAYLFATARTVLAEFWAARFSLPEEELGDEVAGPAAVPVGSAVTSDRAARILDRLPANYRRVLELRFLHGYSLKEVAAETGTTVGGVKVMQLRALRAAAKVGLDV